MSFTIDYTDLPNQDVHERCGEIYVTPEKNIIFLCTLCEGKFDNFEKYVHHISLEHYPFLKEFEIKQDAQSIDHEEIQQIDNETCESEEIQEENFIQEIEIEPVTDTNILPSEYEIHEADILFSSLDCLRETIQTDLNIPEFIDFNKCRPLQKKTSYLRQRQEDNKKFKCSICERKFKDHVGLNKHIERHMTQKSHKCPQCPKKFYAPIDVRVHLRSHAGDRPFLCTICGKTFLTNVKLSDHMRRHTNQRDYKCAYCDKSFYNSGLLVSHLQVHSNNRRFSCCECKAKFAYHKGLRNHMKLHENKKSYKCELCDASFNQQAGLFCHMKNKHKTS